MKIAPISEPNTRIPAIAATQNRDVQKAIEYQKWVRGRYEQERAAAMLARVRLEHRMHSRPATLSVGERQRVAIARALVNRPKLIVADEPTGSLDPKTADSVMNLLLELCEQEGVTLLLVTHDRGIAERLPVIFDCTGLVRETVS